MKQIIFALLLSASTVFGVVLEDGLVKGGSWDTEMLKDKVHVVFYVDPDEKNINDDFSQALKSSRLDKSKFRVVVIVNLKATWIPGFVIESELKKEQKREPDVVFVLDREKRVLKEWGLKDDSSSVLVFDKRGVLVYKFLGKMGEVETNKVVALIKDTL